MNEIHSNSKTSKSLTLLIYNKEMIVLKKYKYDISLKSHFVKITSRSSINNMEYITYINYINFHKKFSPFISM